MRIEDLLDSAFNLVSDSGHFGGMLARDDPSAKTFGYQYQVRVHLKPKGF